MKIIARSLILLSLFAFTSFDLFDEISQSIRSGDAHSLSRYFGTNVDLTIINQQEVYSKTQAEQLLKDFFSKNYPVSFEIIHRGVSKEGSQYAIGKYTSVQGTTYRTYFYIKQNNNTYFIQELRFMAE